MTMSIRCDQETCASMSNASKGRIRQLVWDIIVAHAVILPKDQASVSIVPALTPTHLTSLRTLPYALEMSL